MSKEDETQELDEEERESEGWKEYWLVVGGVSHLAEQAIESVGGRVERLMAHRNLSTSVLFAVCLLHDEHDEDDDQGFGWFTDDGKKARKLYVCSPDAHHDLYIYCMDGSVPRFETSTPELRIITEAEWFDIADEKEETENKNDVSASVLAAAREEVDRTIPWHTSKDARLYECGKDSKQWYVEVDMVHVDDETDKILLLCRVWQDETTGELKAIRVHIE